VPKPVLSEDGLLLFKTGVVRMSTKGAKSGESEHSKTVNNPMALPISHGVLPIHSISWSCFDCFGIRPLLLTIV
jgi:hypothetical protein